MGGWIFIYSRYARRISFEISCHCSWFQKKFVGQNANIWICTSSINALVTALAKRIKRGYGLKYADHALKSHIRVLSFWIKRGYSLKYAKYAFKSCIGDLSKMIKRGYSSKYANKPNILVQSWRERRQTMHALFLFYSNCC